jgi:hypothetical protein
MNYVSHQVTVEQQTHYINRGNESLAEVVFNIEPNRIAGAFALDSITLADDTPVPAYELTGRRLVVELAEPLAPGCALDLRFRFQLTVPPVGEGLSGYSGYFGYTERQFNLGHWLPTLATRSSGGWITHEALAIGEQIVSDIADWDVTLHVSNAPENLALAAPGVVAQTSADSWHVTHRDAREISLSMSDQFNVLQRQATNGVTVELYSFDDAIVQGDNGTYDGAEYALNSAARSLAMFADLFGDYPYDRFVVVQGDFPDGMELSDLVFVSGDWFRTYAGDPASYLTIITVHEVAHQWWYARVGNDQAMTPWLDEALATYSEYIYFEEYYPALKDWWWGFRVGTFVPPDFTGASVDSTVYQFSTIREYINAVYLRGARMLDSLRRDLGTDAFFDWLRRYAEAGSGRVVTPDLFWSLLTPEELMLTQNTRAAYLSSSVVDAILPEATESGS